MELINVRLSAGGNSIIILNQTRLPGKTEYKELCTAEEFYHAIYSLEVRGAPCIGIFAAYALAVLCGRIDTGSFEEFRSQLIRYKNYLNSARPTAVNLGKMLNRIESHAVTHKNLPIDKLKKELLSEAVSIHEEDKQMCFKISDYGLSLVKDGDSILTHCNAGPLATSRYGTAQGPFFLAKERGISLKAYCDETRPLLQGARITTYELSKSGIDCTLICDSMASMVMKQGLIDAVFVGCDRVAVNGDAANKIGTSGVAVLAKYYGIPFYVLGPSSTIDFSCRTGDDIEIEYRDSSEIKSLFFSGPVALPEVKCINPSFDVTPNELITAIVTERGICRAPYEDSFRKLFPEQFTKLL